MPKAQEQKLIDRVTVNAEECAILLGVSKPTVYELLHRDGFPCFKLGTRTLISVDGLRRWVQKQTEGGDGLGS